VSQISPPVRILLIGAVVFLAAWFTILKPKPAEVPPLTTSTTTDEPVSAAGKAVDKAKAAAGQKTESAPADTGAATKTTPAPAPQAAPATAIPAEALAKLPKDVAAALEARKVLVLGVFADEAKRWRPMSDDDRYTRNALRDANRYDGGVFVKNVSINRLSTYGPLVNDLHVNQSPSVVVIDGNLQGRVLTGYVDRISINQVIADARDASFEPDITDPFLRDLNVVCTRSEVLETRWSGPTIPGKKARLAALDRLIDLAADSRRAVARLDAPAKWRGLQAETVKQQAAVLRAVTGMRKAYAAGDRSAFDAAYSSVDRKSIARLDRRLDELGVTDCVSNRRS
jgi:hypothetical protein